jgi:hypothetical protein
MEMSDSIDAVIAGIKEERSPSIVPAIQRSGTLNWLLLSGTMEHLDTRFIAGFVSPGAPFAFLSPSLAYHTI